MEKPAAPRDTVVARHHTMHLNDEIPPLSDFPSTKDIAQHPLFRGEISRFLWRLLTLRLSKTGRWFVAATIIFTGYGAVSLELQSYVLFCYAIGLWLAAAVYVALSRPQVTIQAKHPERVCVGETVSVDVTVTQTGRFAGVDLTLLPHWLPQAVDAVPESGVDLPPLTRGKSIHVRLGLRCKQRGMQQLKGYRVETDFPFGLIRAYRTYYQPQSLLVYPAFHPLTHLDVPTGSRYQPGGVALASHQGESFEFLGNREYHEGDSIRDIDWRAMARLSRPIIREYREEYFLRVGVVLDTYVAGGPDAKARAADFERAVSLCAAVSDYMARQDYLVDIFAAGPNLYHLTAGRSLAHLDQILDILACVDPSPDEPFEILEPELQENLSRITTVICVFLNWDETRLAFAQRMAQAGAGVKVILVRDGACTMDPGGGTAFTGPIPTIDKARFDAGPEEL
ncbi:hypothetical protein CCAX7_51940 [Capsulimonas corticalis]|uniref:DUF58 domain-containing protein n=1 Tax=Capsulimonas corticalis TaxID=2219043 RepID=A0A402CPA0_9BACT|nr:DUF58 domain-containing protein [Capsulimonas corticalis]BDI33143.1 hypothetical protein CCAX7_51940 [Capsulimonas corticalis]